MPVQSLAIILIQFNKYIKLSYATCIIPTICAWFVIVRPQVFHAFQQSRVGPMYAKCPVPQYLNARAKEIYMIVL